jgi:hypothetical protein
MTEQCLSCGSTPTANVRFRGMHGLVDTPVWYEVSGPFCRNCGIATFRNATEWQLANIMRSVKSVLRMPSILFGNFSARRQVARLDAPGHPAIEVAPLGLGRPLLLRGRISIALIPVAVVVIAVAAIMHSHTGGSSIKVGSCIQISSPSNTTDIGPFTISTGNAKVVACDGPHNAVVKSVAAGAYGCDSSDEGTIEDRYGDYFCVARV